MILKIEFNNFFKFGQAQGPVGLAVDFILGKSLSSVVLFWVEETTNPILGIFLGYAGSLETVVLRLSPFKSAGITL